MSVRCVVTLNKSFMRMKVMLGELVEEKDSATEGGRVNEYPELQVNNLQQ